MIIEIRNYNTGKDGKQVYSNKFFWKNTSWFNLENYILGIIYCIITLEILRTPKEKRWWRFKIPSFYIPQVYSKNYYEAIEIKI